MRDVRAATGAMGAGAAVGATGAGTRSNTREVSTTFHSCEYGVLEYCGSCTVYECA